ncbi:MAG: DinB family protein [Polyangia bacterium]
MSRGLVVAAVVTSLSLCAREAGAAPARGAGEYARHFAALAKLSVAVAEVMPKEQYAFRPHPDSMTFGDLMVHIASTNYQFCAGQKVHGSPDGRLPGRELLLAMYIHVAHHRGQAEIYLRDKGIKPPSYVI